VHGLRSNVLCDEEEGCVCVVILTEYRLTRRGVTVYHDRGDVAPTVDLGGKHDRLCGLEM